MAALAGQMKIASVGLEAPLFPGVEPVKLLSDQNIAHYDVIILTPEAVISEWCGTSVGPTETVRIGSSPAESNQAPLLERLEIVRHLVEAGSHLIVLLGGSYPVLTLVAEGGSQKVHTHYDWVWFLNNLKFITISGGDAVYCGPTTATLVEVSKKLKFSYAVGIDVPEAIPFLKTPTLVRRRTPETIAAVRRYGDGAVIYAPSLPIFAKRVDLGPLVGREDLVRYFLLEQIPADLNRGDSLSAFDERVYRH